LPDVDAAVRGDAASARTGSRVDDDGDDDGGGAGGGAWAFGRDMGCASNAARASDARRGPCRVTPQKP
jgi:hypothetical protein